MKQQILLSLLIFSFFPYLVADEEEEIEIEVAISIKEPVLELKWIENNLEQIHTKPAVQFSCSSSSTKVEDFLEKKLVKGTIEERLKALNILLKVNAPRSARQQYDTFIEFKKTHQTNEAIKLARSRFTVDYIKPLLKLKPPAEPYSAADDDYHWAIYCAGIIKAKEFLPRLLELSDQNHLDTHLVAELSIEQFEGEIATDALIKVVSFWRYNSFVKAAKTLTDRDPVKFLDALKNMTPPKRYRYQYALMLAKLNDPSAVPHLCATVKKIAIKDGKMFDEIARLGGPEHKELIEKLPSMVRDNQVDRAKRCVEEYLTRIRR